jgi:hypothetical protein
MFAGKVEHYLYAAQASFLRQPPKKGQSGTLPASYVQEQSEAVLAADSGT